MLTELDVLPLARVAAIEMGQSPSSVFVNDSGHGVPFLQGNAEFGPDHPEARLYCTRPGKLAQPDDILISVRAPVGAVNRADREYGIGRGLAGVRFTAADPRYGFHALELAARQLHRVSQGTTFEAVGKNELQQLLLSIPSLTEQRRISEVLDTAEEAIRQTEMLIANLKQIKQGLLHDLLIRGLNGNGELRDPVVHPEQFKNSPLGWIPLEWEVSNVEAEFHLATGFTLGAHRVPRFRPRKYLRVANVHRDEVRLEDLAELEASDAELVGRTLELDDLLIVEGHANPNEIARCARVPSQAVGLTFQNHLFRLRSKRIHPVFSCAWLNGDYARRYWRRMTATSSGLHTINSRMLMRLDVIVPQPAEQREIVDVIVAHNARIHAEEAYRGKLQLLKKGLMQDLLTGRVRVPVPEREPELVEAGV
jgi:type I restriction enzyme S subunit